MRREKKVKEVIVYWTNKKKLRLDHTKYIKVTRRLPEGFNFLLRWMNLSKNEGTSIKVLTKLEELPSDVAGCRESPKKEVGESHNVEDDVVELEHVAEVDVDSFDDID
ncbi:hypothetical protein V6N12_045992 [Hibiscus sabdariffa]|uniref:Uncharacterized protein n=1 Tax=Hibiscus sabdariffa TaxID=183260 RepID=A0ABR2G5A0_9ROSI